MRQEDSNTLWSQLDGSAMSGDYQGHSMEMVGTTITTWAEWRAEHPDTQVMVPTPYGPGPPPPAP